MVLQQQKTGKTADLVLLALFGGVTAEGEGFGMAGRESQRFSLCVHGHCGNSRAPCTPCLEGRGSHKQ